MIEIWRSKPESVACRLLLLLLPKAGCFDFPFCNYEILSRETQNTFPQFKSKSDYSFTEDTFL